jgi:DNA-binding MarR family transcriptional regulator
MTKPPDPADGTRSPFDDLLGYHLRRASMVVMADFAQSLSPLGLRPADASILFLLAAQPNISQSEIGRTLGILRANMAPLIAGLIKLGLLERKQVDGRSHALRLSALGRSVNREARALAHSHEDRIFGSLSPAVRARLMSELRTLWQQ